MGLSPITLATMTVGTTGVSIAPSGQLCASVYIEADSNNTGAVYVGDSNISTTRFMTNVSAQGGIWINAGYPSRPDATNLQLSGIYVAGSVAGQLVHVTYLERLGGLT
jgi:hypothetical protein